MYIIDFKIFFRFKIPVNLLMISKEYSTYCTENSYWSGDGVLNKMHIESIYK